MWVKHSGSKSGRNQEKIRKKSGKNQVKKKMVLECNFYICQKQNEVLACVLTGFIVDTYLNINDEVNLKFKINNLR